MLRIIGALAAAALAAACAPKVALPLVTTGESSQFIRTGRYDEALRLCRDFARSYDHVRCEEIGRTGQDRPLVALIIQRRPKLPTVYIQAGIHAGEIEGKDAGFWFLRDLLDGKVAPGALDQVSVVFIPVVNPDGHEQFSPNNRPNQRGPAEMGFRTNAARLNLNRDYVKADTPEIQALLRVFLKYQPALLVDLHTTDGAKFEHDISINVAPVAPRGDALDAPARALSAYVVKRLAELGNLPVAFYPAFITNDDPTSGFAINEAPPRFSQFYAAARNRLGLLVETHSWRTYKERTLSTYRSLQAILETAQQHGAQWIAAEAEADKLALALGGRDVPMAWTNGPHKTELAFRGYAYEKTKSEISGADWIVYDEKTPQIWRIPLYDELIPKVTVRVPRGGYIVDGGFAKDVARVLDRHGIQYAKVAGAWRAPVEVFRATKVAFHPTFEGRTPAELTGAWTREDRTLQHGALYVPIQQPAARLILQLFEPALPDSLAAWGNFNAALERKEYMEGYVAEQVARDLLAADPSLRAKFDADVAADPELAKSPERRLEWFYRRHASWDERVNLLPVYRTEAAPSAASAAAPVTSNAR